MRAEEEEEEVTNERLSEERVEQAEECDMG
jgi:hypothetical protein